MRLGAVAVPIDLRLRGRRARRRALRGLRGRRRRAARTARGGPRGAPLSSATHDLDATAIVVHTSGTTSAPQAGRADLRQLAVERARLGRRARPRSRRALAVHAAAVARRRPVDPAAQRDLRDDGRRARRLRRGRGRRRARSTAARRSSRSCRRRSRACSTPGWSDPPALRAALVGGGPIPPALLERARAAGVPTVTTYGLTEACSQVTTGGPPLFCTRVRDRRRRRDPRRRPDGRAAARRGRRLAAHRRPRRAGREGNLTVTGRAADTIVTGGENVAPAEVEAVLATHPAVADVAVHGVPDAEWGERIVATIVLRPGTHRNSARAGGLLSCPPGRIQGAQSVQVLPRLAEDAVGKAPAPRSGGMNATNGPSSLADHRRCRRRHARRPCGGAGGHVHGQGAATAHAGRADLACGIAGRSRRRGGAGRRLQRRARATTGRATFTRGRHDRRRAQLARRRLARPSAAAAGGTSKLAEVVHRASPRANRPGRHPSPARPDWRSPTRSSAATAATASTFSAGTANKIVRSVIVTGGRRPRPSSSRRLTRRPTRSR